MLKQRMSVVLFAVVACAPYVPPPMPNPAWATPAPPVERTYARADSGMASVSEAVGHAVAAVQASAATRLAVLEIRSLDGGRTMLGRFLAEEITTAVERTGAVKVVERRLIDEMTSEGKFSETGLVDDASAAEIGGKLGADAVLAGTLTDLDTSIRFNLRVINAKTGQVVAADQAVLVPDEPLRRLWQQALHESATPAAATGPSNPVNSSRADRDHAESPVITGSAVVLSSATVTAVTGVRTLPATDSPMFLEDFTRVAVGSVPAGWIGVDHFAVSETTGGRRRFACFERGPARISIPTGRLPRDYRVEAVVTQKDWTNSGAYKGDLSIQVGGVRGGITVSYFRGSAAFVVDSTKPVERPRDGVPVTVALEKRGSLYRILVDGMETVMSRRQTTERADRVIIELNATADGVGCDEYSWASIDRVAVFDLEGRDGEH